MFQHRRPDGAVRPLTGIVVVRHWGAEGSDSTHGHIAQADVFGLAEQNMFWDDSITYTVVNEVGFHAHVAHLEQSLAQHAVP